MDQRSDEWFAARLGKVTASKVKDVMAKGRGGAPSATRQNYMMQLLCERLTGMPGWYSTEQTPEGYAVESSAHRNSVQIYPAKALEAVDD